MGASVMLAHADETIRTIRLALPLTKWAAAVPLMAGLLVLVGHTDVLGQSEPTKPLQAGPAQISSAPKSGIDRMVELQLTLMKLQKLEDRRGQHPKSHGCVRAQFEVLPDLPAPYKVGLFAKPATYTAHIRFSNGKHIDDTNRDIHGMAIKLTGVPGRKILDTESEATTHDFILADHPVFFIQDTDEYVAFIESLLQKPPLASFHKWLSEHNRDRSVLDEFLKGHDRDSPFSTQYWG